MGASQSSSASNDQLEAVKVESSLKALSVEMNPTKIKGLTRLFMEESKRRHDKDRDEHDLHKVDFMLYTYT